MVGVASPSPAASLDELQRIVTESAAALDIPAADTAQALESRDYFPLMESLVARRGADPPAPVRESLAALEQLLRMNVFDHPAGRGRAVPPVVFGTGGHRGVIGEGLTLVHVHAITGALIGHIEDLTPASREHHFGHADLGAVKRAGVVIGHDNRLFNPDFSFYAAHLLQDAGYSVRYAGRVATPELSCVGPVQGWAASLNFTPSHNPFRYGGIKLSPTDGGLAGSDITDPLAERANELLHALSPADWRAPQHLAGVIEAAASRVTAIDVHAPYLERLTAHPVVRLQELIATMQALPPAESLHLCADPVWGAAVPVYKRLQAMLGADYLTLLHTEDDPYFGGQTTEPNEQTLEDALAVVRESASPFTVAIRNDPDSDRGLVGDAHGAIKMNRYAVVVARYLQELGLEGGLATTSATSHFGPAFARSQGRAVFITPVGFKNFRPHLVAGEVMIAYEESDGMTIAGHSLDKDGVLAGLLACRMVLHYRKPLHEILAETEARHGRYYWHQINFEIDMPAAEATQALNALREVRPGQMLEGAGQSRRVRETHCDDGFKFIFDDDTWVMIRPSGTEPKIRVYGETQQNQSASEALCEMGQALALDTLAKSR